MEKVGTELDKLPHKVILDVEAIAKGVGYSRSARRAVGMTRCASRHSEAHVPIWEGVYWINP